MSPARRRLLQLLAAAVVLLVVVVVAIDVVRKDPEVVGADQSQLGTVLLVPGYGGTTGSLQPLATRLREAGRQAVVVSLPGDGTGDLKAAAGAVGSAADKAISGGAPSVDLVGYSAGGVVARLYVASGGATKVRRVITLGSPHHGTKVAALAKTFAAGECPVACQQLVPGSALLHALTDTPAGPRWISLWTDTDEVVTPPDSARLDGALDLVVQDVCPTARLQHGDLPDDPLVERIVLQELGTGPVTTPTGC